VKASEAIHSQLTAIIEAELGREVVGFMSSSQQDPSLFSHVFVLDSSELLKDADTYRASHRQLVQQRQLEGGSVSLALEPGLWLGRGAEEVPKVRDPHDCGSRERVRRPSSR
jgi:hypothetical protein